MRKTIIVSENAFYSKRKDNAVILNYDTGMYFGLDPIGSEYWELIQENRDFNLIVEKMLCKYQDIARESIESDLNELIESFISKGLVTVH